MKKLLAKTWFKIVAFGVVIGTGLIMLDNQFNFFNAKSDNSGNYNGPVTIEKDKAYFTTASLNQTSVDFGKVKEGDTLSHIFKISNTGNEPLIIYKTSGSCDCVAAVVTKELIPPGKEVDITAYFNTIGRKGSQNKTLEITCNTEPAQLLITIKAQVE